jgi:hypothetical protein
MVSPEVILLAENLRKNGLATTHEEAIRRAEMMLGQSFSEPPPRRIVVDTKRDFKINIEQMPLKEAVEEQDVDIGGKRMPAGTHEPPKVQEPPVAQREERQQETLFSEPELPEANSSEPQFSEPAKAPDFSPKAEAKPVRKNEPEIDLSEFFKAKPKN